MAQKESIIHSGVPEGNWRSLHPITPVAQTWTVFAAIIGYVLFQMADDLRSIFSSDFLWGPGYYGYSMLVIVIFAVAAGTLILTLLVGLYSWLAWRRMQYAITSEAVYYRAGIFFRSQRVARLNKVQAVNITHPLLGRIFGLGRIDIEVAGGADSNLQFGLLKTAELEGVRLEILQQLKALKNGATVSVQNIPEGDAALPTADGALENPTQATVPGSFALEGKAKKPTREPALGNPPQVNADPLTTLLNEETEGQLIYSVPVRRLLVATFVNMGVIISLLAIFIGLMVNIVLIVVFEASWSSFFAIGVPALTGLSALNKMIGGNFNFRAYLAPDGIRVRAGLTETRAQTIAPGRIHAVKIIQPYFWRFFDWYKVEISQAAFQGGTETKETSILLPVGTRADMLRAVWLVFPNLGVEDPINTLRVGLEGFGDGDGFVNNPRRARIWDWWTYSRNAHCLTDRVLITRGGRITRRCMVFSYPRMQSLQISQGPWMRKRKLATVGLHTVDTAASSDGALMHLDEQVAVQLFNEISRHALARRQVEKLDSWLQRVQVGLETKQSYEGGKTDSAQLLTAAVNPLETKETPENQPEMEENVQS